MLRPVAGHHARSKVRLRLENFNQEELMKSKIIKLAMASCFASALVCHAVVMGQKSSVASLDRMIEHQRFAIDEAKTARAESDNSEFHQVFDDLIAQHEKELKRMSDLRNKLYPGVAKTTPLEGRWGLTTMESDLDDEMQKMESGMRNMFNHLSSRLRGTDEIVQIPRVEIQDEAKGYSIKAEIPGMTKDDVKVQVAGQNVTIDGKREVEVKREDKGYTSSEFSYGNYHRTIRLALPVDPKSLTTKFNDGILNIHLNKLAGKKQHKA